MFSSVWYYVNCLRPLALDSFRKIVIDKQAGMRNESVFPNLNTVGLSGRPKKTTGSRPDLLLLL
jgi:hypothetical protein